MYDQTSVRASFCFFVENFSSKFCMISHTFRIFSFEKKKNCVVLLEKNTHTRGGRRGRSREKERKTKRKKKKKREGKKEMGKQDQAARYLKKAQEMMQEWTHPKKEVKERKGKERKEKEGENERERKKEKGEREGFWIGCRL